MAGTGTRGGVVRSPLLLKLAISPASNGRERPGAPGMRRLVRMLLQVVILPASNGRERTAVNGTRTETYEAAAEGGHLSCLQWAREKNGCPWNERICLVLVYRWNRRAAVRHAATENGHL